MEDKSFIERNMEMWEKWSGSYIDLTAGVAVSAAGRRHPMVIKAMEKGMEQSAAVQKQIDKAVGMAVQAQSEATLTAIKALEHQVEVLSERVNEMLKDR